MHSLRPTRLMFVPLLLAGAVPVQAADAPTGMRFDHHDWTVACDNTRTCRAAGYQADNGHRQPLSVLLTRAGGPNQAVTAELMLGMYDESTPPVKPRLRINGQDLGAVADTGAGPLSAAQTAALLKALTRDSTILIVSADKRQWQLSDRGASAVLLKMDEFQGRLGTPGALLRKGNRAEATVLSAVPVPVVRQAALVAARPGDAALAGSAALRAALKTALAPDACHVLASGERDEPLTVRRLSADKLLVSTQCWMGAYNVGEGYWVTNDRAPFNPHLVTTRGSDEDEGSINAAHKIRGLGDCWSIDSWTWDGRQFVHTAAATTGMCRLVAAGGAWDMPILVTRVVK